MGIRTLPVLRNATTATCSLRSTEYVRGTSYSESLLSADGSLVDATGVVYFPIDQQ